MKLFKSLFQQTDNSPLVIFRIVFGFLLCWHMVAVIVKGVMYADFIKPPFTFSFIGFEWLQPLPGNGMYYYAWLMALLALMVMLGAWYRLAITGFALLWTMLYLMQKANYNNHYYLVLLLCWIMVFLPANRFYSVDVKRKAVAETNFCSRYCILIFIAQMAIVYFYAALSKLNFDWLSGKFIAIEFSSLSRRPLLGHIYGNRWFRLFICYGGLLSDLLIVPLLLWRKTRTYAFIVSCLFHLFNAFTFPIGIFPYLGIALNIFFFDGTAVRRIFFGQPVAPVFNTYTPNSILKKKIIACCFSVYVFFQVIIPMRSWLYPGNVFWNEEGYRMSWKMMMRIKNGTVYFKVIDTASHQSWKVDPAKIFARYHVTWLAISPDIIWQYSQRIKKEFAEKGYPNAEIFAVGQVSLNRSKPMPLIDSTVNLAAIKWQAFHHSTWITPGPEH